MITLRRGITSNAPSHSWADDYKGTTGGLEVVMRSIIYAAYSKDLSVKTTTAKIQMMKQGKYVGGYAPYGQLLLCW